MKLRRSFCLAALGALFLLSSGGAFFAPAPAAAYNSFNVDESADDGGNLAVKDFLTKHGMKLVIGLAVGMGALFVMFMGPAEVLDAARRQHDAGHGLFGHHHHHHGLFGSDTDSTPGFGSGGFGSNYKL